MDWQTLGLTLVILVSWSFGDLFSKMAASVLGEKAVFFHYIFYVSAIVVYSIFVYKPEQLFGASRQGVLLAAIGGIVSFVGAIALFKLLATKDLSIVVSLKSLGPAFVTILAFIILREEITLQKIVGVVLAGAAIYFLST